MDYKKIKKVKLNGKWYTVESSALGVVCIKGFASPFTSGQLDKLVTETEMIPEPPVFNWFEPKNVMAEEPKCIGSVITRGDIQEVNEYLTKAYGNPEKYLYKGESPNTYGLSYSSMVLVWSTSSLCWHKREFSSLENYDVWTRLPIDPPGYMQQRSLIYKA